MFSWILDWTCSWRIVTFPAIWDTMTLMWWRVSGHLRLADLKDSWNKPRNRYTITTITRQRYVLSVETRMGQPLQSSSRRCLSSRLVSRWVVSHLPRSGWSTHQGKYARMPSMLSQRALRTPIYLESTSSLTVTYQSTGPIVFLRVLRWRTPNTVVST